MTTSSTVQESPEKEYGLLSSKEQAIFTQITTMKAPYSQRAQALLALSKGATQVEACRQSGLSQGQVRYWLAKFRRDGMGIFPEELLNQAQPEIQADTPDVLAIEQSRDEEDDQPEMLDAEETTVPVDNATGKPEEKSKSKKNAKKKTKKAKKGKKTRRERKERSRRRKPKRINLPKKLKNKRVNQAKRSGKTNRNRFRYQLAFQVKRKIRTGSTLSYS